MTTHEYKPLCEIVIRHGFYLNDGAKDFDTMTDAEKKVALKRYNFSEALTIEPIPATARTLQKQQAFFRQYPDRMALVVKTESGDLKPLVDLADDLTFVFLVKTKDPVFPQLTNNEFVPGRIFLFTNCQPAEFEVVIDENADPDAEVPEPTIVEQLPKLADSERISNNYLLSVEDTAVLLEKYTTPADRFGLIGMIYLRVKGSGTGNNMLTSGETTADYPVFKMHFNNASTYWKYKKPSANFEAATSDPKPLTKYGFIKITEGDFPNPKPPASYKFPNPRPETFEITPTKTYSVIFI